MIDYYVSEPAPAQARGYKIKIDRIELHCPIGQFNPIKFVKNCKIYV